RVADFQRELEAYTGRSWQEFFQDWLYGNGLCDWAIEKVSVKEECGKQDAECPRCTPRGLAARLGLIHDSSFSEHRSYKVSVDLRQKAEYDEETVLGIALPCMEGYSVRIPILPQATRYQLDEPRATVQVLGKGRV